MEKLSALVGFVPVPKKHGIEETHIKNHSFTREFREDFEDLQGGSSRAASRFVFLGSLLLVHLVGALQYYEIEAEVLDLFGLIKVSHLQHPPAHHRHQMNTGIHPMKQMKVDYSIGVESPDSKKNMKEDMKKVFKIRFSSSFF